MRFLLSVDRISKYDGEIEPKTIATVHEIHEIKEEIVSQE